VNDERAFVIGRKSDSDLAIDADTLSRHHAEIVDFHGKLCLRDLNSTNGTYLNDHEVTAGTPIEDGDVIRLGDIQLRIIIDKWEKSSINTDSEHTIIATGKVVHEFSKDAKEIETLIKQKLVKSVLQPIVNTKLDTVAYELLGRGCHSLLPESPSSLFYLAEQKGSEIELSKLFLEAGLCELKNYSSDCLFFFNLHPKEIEDLDYLFRWISKIRENNSETRFVLEVPEKAVTHIDKLKRLKHYLQTLEIGLAFDDFGAGQARLLELSEVSPDILKLDFCLIHNLDTASPARQRMIEMLVNYSHDLNIKLLAEGVETAAESEYCRQIGIDLLQGFYYGQPGHNALNTP
ncbi:MAG: EAL domain-containing protein, partial [Nitrosomonas sp.]|nr:EAL domain-containing protein [Nitrosomonas sp.]